MNDADFWSKAGLDPELYEREVAKQGLRLEEGLSLLRKIKLT